MILIYRDIKVQSIFVNMKLCETLKTNCKGNLDYPARLPEAEDDLVMAHGYLKPKTISSWRMVT